MIFCPKCGLRNEDDAGFCKACGSKLKKRPYRFAGQQKEETKSKKMATSIKALIIACIVLVAGLGLTFGILLKSGPDTINPSIAGNPNTQTNSQSNQPKWHQVATFTGSTDDYRTVNIKGNQFKVTMSAVPRVSYDINAFSVDIFRGDAGVATGTINWGATENPKKKEHVIHVKEGAGPYDLKIYATDLESWTVTVWDYY